MTKSLRTAITAAGLPLLLRLGPEMAHDWGLAGLKVLRQLKPTPPSYPGLAMRCFGLNFAHPLGLAAGFDKNGDYLDVLGDLGFSHIELGTVTPRPQAGNSKPRMFRMASQSALVNRMGFNNKGVDYLIGRLSRSSYRGIRGVSIGKNADTPIDQAEDDYVACLRKVYPHADYIAVNVSSPNTAKLRQLQDRDGLERVIGALLQERVALQSRHGRVVPLLVKIAPNLDTRQVTVITGVLRAMAPEGVIATNTSTDLRPLGERWPDTKRGGLSGAPVHAMSVAVIAQLRAELPSGYPIIGVGGIVSADNALASLRAGADLLQVYTGFAYRGEKLIAEILAALDALARR